MTIKLIAASLAVLTLTACATKPKVEPIVEQPVAEAPPKIFETAPPPTVAQAPQPSPIIEQGPIIDPNAPAPGSIADFAYQAGGEPRVFFGYDSYTLNADARAALGRQAQWLMTYSNVTAIIEGNADERGTREYNLALGARRADSVKAFLVSQGVSPSRLTTVSYGKERPIDARSSEAGWSRNRNGHTNINSGAIG